MFRTSLFLPSVRLLAACAVLPSVAAPLANPASVPKWSRFEIELQSRNEPDAPLDLAVTGVFRGPSGAARTALGFWDGGRTWRVRFAPDEEGRWTYQTRGPERSFERKGGFRCTAPRGATLFERRGPVAVAADQRRLVHRDGTPFFWLADTAWNGPLNSTDADWEHYLAKRASQGFTAIQWVATQWRGAPQGDAEGRPAYTGAEPIRVKVDFFQRLERKHAAILRAGMLSVPVMLWAIQTKNGSEVNPGLSLPERDAALLARYMLARWGSDPVVWLLNGDGDYRGAKAERWRNIGRATFAGVWHAPVSLHPGGRMWVMDEFRGETWLDICGYQSAHSDSDGNSQWIHSGPPAQEWTRTPAKPVMSLEAPYDRAQAAGAAPIDFVVRRNHLWSLLNALAGITYGVHGVWGWSDGVHPAPGHGTTVWPHWKTLLDLPGAAQTTRIRRILESMEWTRLEPAPGIVAEQPGAKTPRAFIAAAQTASKNATVIYTPEAREVVLARGSLPGAFDATWLSPASGERSAAKGTAGDRGMVFATPAAGDWLLLVRAR